MTMAMAPIGTALLWAVLVAAVWSTVAWVWAARSARSRQRDGPSLVVASGPARTTPALDPAARWGLAGMAAAFAAALVATALLQWALLLDPTALDYSARVATEQMPVYYRITAMWSALEGSLLLWLVMLAATALAATVLIRQVGLLAGSWAAAILSALVSAFAVVSLVASPFVGQERFIGQLPSPLLQDHIAMGVHPPLLYGGFILLAVPYAFVIAALVTTGVDAAWGRALRRWVLLAWIMLTAGIVLGAWWSYAVLGWGGYWAWDPVENASLLPWLSATALIHALGVRSTGPGWRAWAAVHAGLSFVFVVLATLLTRSGIVESIHAFTVSSLGPLLLVLLVAVTAAWLIPLIRHRSRLVSPTGRGQGGFGLHVNQILLTLIAAIVTVGTVLPSLVQMITGERLFVGAPWYHRTLAPVALALLVAMAVTPYRARRGSSRLRMSDARLPAVLGLLITGVTAILTTDVWLAVVAGLAAFVLVTLVRVTLRTRSRSTLTALGGLTAHVGVALAAVAVLAGTHGHTTQQSIAVGETVTAGSFTATLIGVGADSDERISTARAEVVLSQDGDYLGSAYPELRWYERERTMIAGPEIRSDPVRDIYVTLLDVDPAGASATIRLAVTPMVWWLWAATGLVILGATLSAIAGAGAQRTGRRQHATDHTDNTDNTPDDDPRHDDDLVAGRAR